MKEYDFVVIGSGIAGLTFALKAARHGSVAVVTKRKGADTNTAWAQGGVACVTGDDVKSAPAIEGAVELRTSWAWPTKIDEEPVGHMVSDLHMVKALEYLRSTVQRPRGS